PPRSILVINQGAYADCAAILAGGKEPASCGTSAALASAAHHRQSRAAALVNDYEARQVLIVRGGASAGRSRTSPTPGRLRRESFRRNSRCSAVHRACC